MFSRPARELVALKVEMAVGVVATSTGARIGWKGSQLCTTALWLLANSAQAAVLPEDRADYLYHYYDGGGVTIDGPSILARKQLGDSTSVAANYYVDTVSSASIDVVTTASAYSEERTETSLSVDYLHDKTTLSTGYTRSEESDYLAKTAYVSISQDFFGDLSTLTLGYSQGRDTVYRIDTNVGGVERQNFRLGLTQVLSKSWIVSGNVETITDEGFLNNSYRQVRYVDPGAPRGYSFEPERYPATRTSSAVSLQSMYYLEHRAAIRNFYRYFADDWDIQAHTFEIGYVHPWRDVWTFAIRFRHYSQSSADFYSDLFPFSDAQNFLARDKELSTFTSNTIGFGVSYDMLRDGWRFVDSGRANVILDFVSFDYEDFRDIRGTVNSLTASNTGSEPTYGFDAIVLRLFFSIWY